MGTLVILGCLALPLIDVAVAVLVVLLIIKVIKWILSK